MPRVTVETTMPRVTVIIATYNWSSVLPYSIGSALHQTFRDFELLVIGDGCTDDSERVVMSIDDPRVRWINLERRAGHQYGPNNEGLRQARGELIAYLGHDDLWLPQHLDLAVRAIDDGADLTHSILLTVDPRNEAKLLLPARNGWKAPTSVVHRKAITDRLGGWRDYREVSRPPELYLWTQAAAAGFRLRYLQRVTGVKFPASERRDVYRQRPSHQQSQWLERIRNEPDLEAVELARLVLQTHQPASLARRALRLLGQPWRWSEVLRRRKGGDIRAGQRYKGVE